MKVSRLFKFKDPDIKALHLTWIAFFITFYVWFNMAPLATTMVNELGWLTTKDKALSHLQRGADYSGPYHRRNAAG